MEVAALRDRIQSTLDTNADNRRQAEVDLKYVRFQCHDAAFVRLTDTCYAA